MVYLALQYAVPSMRQMDSVPGCLSQLCVPGIDPSELSSDDDD